MKPHRRSGLRAIWNEFSRPQPVPASYVRPRIGLALGGGFARGIAHAGVIRVLEQNHIPLHCITGVSAGAMVAAAFASGSTPDEIARIGCSMKFADVARWTICRMGFAGSERMSTFLRRLLKTFTFEEMHTPLGVIATDLATGQEVIFRDKGDVTLPIRASCSYPGLFQPVRDGNRLLVDGAMSCEVPAALAKKMGATHVISVQLPMQGKTAPPHNMFQVVNRCFQIMQTRMEAHWRAHSDLVIEPDARDVEWDGFGCATKLVEAGEKAAYAALPEIQKWLEQPSHRVATSSSGIMVHQGLQRTA